jgi:hypothetical protein
MRLSCSWAEQRQKWPTASREYPNPRRSFTGERIETACSAISSSFWDVTHTEARIETPIPGVDLIADVRSGQGWMPTSVKDVEVI